MDERKLKVISDAGMARVVLEHISGVLLARREAIITQLKNAHKSNTASHVEYASYASSICEVDHLMKTFENKIKNGDKIEKEFLHV